METQPNKFTSSFPLIISLVALVVSIYSVKLTSESNYINKTQTLVGKRYEILSLMKQLIELKEAESESAQKILWIYEDNPKLLNKEKDRYSYWKNKMDRIRDDINKEDEKQNIFIADKKDYDIYMLENQVGSYKLRVSYAVSANDYTNKFIDKLVGKLSTLVRDNQSKAKDKKQ